MRRRRVVSILITLAFAGLAIYGWRYTHPRETLVYPQGWPLALVQAPSDALPNRQDRLSEELGAIPKGSYSIAQRCTGKWSRMYYSVAYVSNESWEDEVRRLESVLQSHGYFVLERHGTNTPIQFTSSADILRQARRILNRLGCEYLIGRAMYASEDSRCIITVMKSSRGWQLSIAAFDSPLDADAMPLLKHRKPI